MDQKFVFLDRDGTINVDYGYVFQKEKLTFLPGVIEGLKLLSNKGFKFIIITNQSGIERGLFTEEQFLDFEKYLEEKLADNNIYIEKTYYCPHYMQNCDCRKPKTGLFYKAQKDFNIDFSNSYVIGDRERDLSICKEQPVEGFLIDSNNDFFCIVNRILQKQK